MAEQKDSPSTLDLYAPFRTERRWTPFYKRYVFTGPSQADQAANLITSPSFTNFWSSGGSQADNVSAIHVTSQTRDYQVSQMERGKYDIDITKPTRPRLPTPPEGIRDIDIGKTGFPRTYYPKEGVFYEGNFKKPIPEHLYGDNIRIDLPEHLNTPEHLQGRLINGGYDPHPNSPWRPRTLQYDYPLFTHEEHNYWNSVMKGTDPINGGFTDKIRDFEVARSKFNSIPAPLRNEAGAMLRDDRALYSMLRYHTDGSKQGLYRGVDASTPSNFAGVSAEFENYTQGGKFSPRPNWNSNIMYTSTTSPDVALDRLNSQRVLGAGDTIRLNQRAVQDLRSASDSFGNIVKPYNTQVEYDPLLDIAQQEPEAFALRKNSMDSARRVGVIKKDFVSGVHNGKPWVEPLNKTTTTVYGPPVKGMAAEVAVGNTLHYGGKTVGLLGAVSEGVSIPLRRYHYINEVRKQNGLPPLSEPYDVNKFPDANASELVQGQILGTGEAMANFISMGIWDHYAHPEWEKPREPVQRGFYSDSGIKVPNWVPNYQSTLIDRNRYERQGVSFDHVYKRPPL